MGSQIFESQSIVDALRGQTLHVPNLLDVFKGWPVIANARYRSIIPVVESAFDRLVKSPVLREKYRKANYARFVSLYYPHPEWNQIETLALYIIWLFCWDDAIDQQGTGDLSNDLTSAEKHRENTIKVLEQVLGLVPKNTPDAEYDHVNAELKTIGEALKKTYTIEQRQTFMAQMRRYIDNCHKEQSLRLCGTLPDLESYQEIRHGTAAVWTLCALIEYGLGENMPENIRSMEEVETIWSETSRCIWITNDILSLKKEMPQEDDGTTESIINAIPIFMNEGKSPQEAVDALLADLSDSVASFEVAAGVLEVVAGEGGRQIIQKYCDACRCMVTGSVQFTFESTRYRLAGCVKDDGSLDIVL